MDYFFQKTLFLKKKFTFRDKGIDIEFTDKDGDFSLFIHYDRIEPREHVRINTKRKSIVLKIGLLAAFVTLAKGFLTANTDNKTTIIIAAVSLFIAGASYVYYYLTQLRYYAIGLVENKRFMVLYDKPNRLAVEEFINEIFRRRNEYYRREYFIINYENQRKTEIERMKWLRSENIISENEFNVVIDEINENIED